MTFAKNLKRNRIKSGLSQEDLARKLEVSVFTVYKWESGAFCPRLRNLGKIAKAIGTTVIVLVR